MDLGAISIYLWDFGDGTGPVYMQNPTHTYAMAGEYEVTLSVTDTATCENSTSQCNGAHPTGGHL